MSGKSHHSRDSAWEQDKSYKTWKTAWIKNFTSCIGL